MLENVNKMLNTPGPLALEPEAAGAIADGAPGPAALRLTTALSTRIGQRASRLRRVLGIADVVALNVAFIVAQALGGLADVSTPLVHLALLAIGLPLWMVLGRMNSLYQVDAWRTDYDVADELGRIVPVATLWSWGILMGGWAVGLLDAIAVPTLAAFWLTAVVALAAARSSARGWARKQLWYWQNAVIVGRPADASPLIQRILRNPRNGINVVACVDVRHRTRFAPEQRRHIGPVPVVGESPSLDRIIRTLGVDRVIVAGATDADYERDVICHLPDQGVHVDFVPAWSEHLGGNLDVHALGGIPLVTAPRIELRPSSLMTKRAMDVVLSAAALVVLAPILAACALAIKINSPGPVLFRQRRVGKGECRFEVIKFRSMYIDAEERKAEVADLSFHGGGTQQGMFKIRQDPRITRVGAFLRRTSLDELPQLINVLRGDMSLVGPRPLIENEFEQIEPRFRRRASLKPGLTGIWQVHGRSEVPFEEMVVLDCLYVRGWSLVGDVKLLARTVTAVLRGQGAY